MQEVHATAWNTGRIFMAKRWVEMGHSVTIAASSFSHLRTEKTRKWAEAKTKEEQIDGIRYFWIAGNSYEGNGLGRIRNMLSFLRGLYANAKKLENGGKFDAVIALLHLSA